MRPADTLLEEQLAIYADEFEMSVSDLLEMSRSRPILAEGTALLPRYVQEILFTPSPAIWLLPEKTFHRRMYQQRGPGYSEFYASVPIPNRPLTIGWGATSPLPDIQPPRLHGWASRRSLSTVAGLYRKMPDGWSPILESV